jgi:hypothetical protein
MNFKSLTVAVLLGIAATSALLGLGLAGLGFAHRKQAKT